MNALSRRAARLMPLILCIIAQPTLAQGLLGAILRGVNAPQQQSGRYPDLSTTGSGPHPIS